MHDQLVDAFAVQVLSVTAVPFFNNVNVIDSGLIPSWLLLSAQIFVAVTSVVSGSCTLVIVNEFSSIDTALPFSYPLIKSNSVIE